MINCYIYGNSEKSASTLREFVENTVNLNFAGQSTNYIKAINEIKTAKPEITFFTTDSDDVALWEIINIIHLISYIIFVTEIEDLALKFYKKFATDFLLSPLSYINFIQIVSKSQQLIRNPKHTRLLSEQTSFYITEEKGKLVRILYEDILFVQGAQNYIRIQLTNHYHLIYLSLKEIEKELPECHFVRVHKSFIVNMDKIKAVEWNRIYFQFDLTVTIGDKYKQKFIELISGSMIKIKK